MIKTDFSVNLKKIKNTLDKKNSVAFSILLILALLVINWKLIIGDPLVDRDDPKLIDPLRNITSVSQYIHKIKKREILDVQPIRDLSFLVNIKLENITGYGGFHVTNLLIWLLILLFFYSLLGALKLTKYRIGIISILALHPSLLTSVFWVSARKHLLSSLFTMLATLLILRTIKNDRYSNYTMYLLLPLAYLASILSQPINILWPLWFLVYTHFFTSLSKRKIISIGGILIAILIAASYANYQYYTGIFIDPNIKNTKFVSSLGSLLDFSILGVGRSFFQIFVPMTLSPLYYVGSWQNLAGIGLLVLFFYLSWKFIKQKSLIWGLFVFLPLAVVYGRITNIFVSDTYLLIPTFGVFIIVVYCLEKIQFSKQFFNIITMIVTFIFMFQSYSWSSAWLSSKSLWTHAYNTEKEPQVLLNYGKFLLEDKEFQKATNLVFQLREWDSSRAWLPWLFARTIYLNPMLDTVQKIDILNKNYMDDPWFNYYLAAVYARQSNWNLATKYSRKGLQNPVAFGKEVSIVLADAMYFCTKIHLDDCSIYIEDLMSKIPSNIYNESTYTKRLEELGVFSTL